MRAQFLRVICCCRALFVCVCVCVCVCVFILSLLCVFWSCVV
jgi:hypothetical protein